MQAGQSVKINTGAKTPLNGEDYWETAKFLGWWNQADQICEVQIGEPEKVGYRVIHIHRHFVREFRQLEIDENGECPAINEMVQRDIPKISESLTNALAKLLPNTPFAIESNTVVVAYNGSLTMEPVIVETRSIGAFIESPGWSVTVWRQHPATRNQPEDVSDCVVGKYTHYGQAVQKFIETLFLMQSEDYWDNQADLALIEQWEQTHDIIG